MTKKTKTQKVIETTNVISDVLTIVETAVNVSTETTTEAESVSTYDIISLEPEEVSNNTTIATIDKGQISAAIETLQKSVKSLRKEAVTLRAIVRCICDNASNEKITPLAAFFGLTEDSNKNTRNEVVANIAKKYPYYSEVVSENGAIHTQAMKLTKKAEGIYIASAENDCFKAITAVIDNVFGANKHIEVKSKMYYDASGMVLSDQKTAKEAAKEAKEAAKEAKEAEKIEAAKELLGFGEIVSLDCVGLLQEALKRCGNNEATNHIIQAIAALTR